MRSLFAACIALALFTACKKNQAGGNSEIYGTVVHHSLKIPNAVIYIKYNATEFPGEDVMKYDAQIQADSEARYSFKCYKGDYFLYAVGFDNAISEQVKGGVPVKVRSKEKIEATIAVKEEH